MTPNIQTSTPPEEYLHHPNLEKARKLHQGTIFHGTGRLAKDYDDRDKSKPNGKIKDVLTSIVTQGLQPQSDHIAKLILPVTQTISLTKQRIYARLYGEKFGEDDENQTHLEYTFGDHKDWWSYYIGECMKRGQSFKNLPWMTTLNGNLKTRFTTEERKHWRDRDFHKARWFANKAPITGNYPVIFGIDEKDVTPVNLPIGLKDFEVRNYEPIAPSSIKLIEVPNQKVAEVRAQIAHLKIAGYLIDAEVLPIEVGEVVCYQKGVAECAKGNND